MADYATLVYGIDSGQARTAAKDLFAMNESAVAAAKGQENLGRAIRDSSGRFVTSAETARKYGSEIYGLASKYNHAMQFVFDYQRTEEELSRAVALGVVGKKQAADILERLRNSAAAAAVGLNNAAGGARVLSAAMSGLRNVLGSVVGQLSIMAAATLSFRAVTSTLSDFEKSMSSVQAVTNATTEDMRLMREMAKDLGATTEFTASQAAEGLRFLGMAGFSTRDSLAAIPAVLDLSTAAALDLGRAADIASNMMSAFGIAAADAASVADVLATAANSANTDVAQLGDGMKYVGPVAAAMGISINDTAAAIGTLSDAGIQGGMAGTGLRRVLSSLANVTPKAKKTLDAMGVSLDKVNPATNDLADIVSTLAAAGLNASDALTIFGDRGGPAILALVENSARLQSLTDRLQDVEGAASRMAGVMRDNLRGDFDTLKAAAEGLIISLGEAGLTDTLRMLTKGATALITGISGAVDLFGKVTAGGKGLAAVLGILAASRVPALASGMWSLVGGLSAASIGMGATTVASRTATVSLGAQAVAARGLGVAMKALGGPVGLAAAGIAAIGMALYSSRAAARDYQQAQTDALRAVAEQAEVLRRSYSDLEIAYKSFVDKSTQYSAQALKTAAEAASNANDERLRQLYVQLSALQNQSAELRRQIEEMKDGALFTELVAAKKEDILKLDEQIAAVERSISEESQNHLMLLQRLTEAAKFLADLEANRAAVYGGMNEDQREAYDEALKAQAVQQRALDLQATARRYGKDSIEYAKLQVEQERQIELAKLEALRAQADGNEEASRAVDLAIALTNEVYDSTSETVSWERAQSRVNDQLKITRQLLASISGSAISVAAIRAERQALEAGASLREAGLVAARETARLEGEAKTQALTDQYGLWGKILGTADAAAKQIAISEAASLDLLKDAIREQERADRKGGKGAARRAEAELRASQKGFQSLRQLMEQDSLFQVAEWEKRQAQLEMALEKRLITTEQYLTLEAQLRQMYFGSEYERQQLQYDMDLEQLRAHLEARRITQEQYNAQSTALMWGNINQEADLNNSRWSAELNGLATHMGQLNELAGSGYDKLLKAQKVFGAASALISTYQGAAKALELPFPYNMAAMAKVLAAGMGLVSAIKSGGKAGGKAGSASAGIAAKQEPTRNVLIRLEGSDFMVDLAESMLEQIYEQSRDGRVIISRDR